MKASQKVWGAFKQSFFANGTFNIPHILTFLHEPLCQSRYGFLPGNTFSHTPFWKTRAIKSGLLNHERAWPDCKSEVPSSLISRVVLLRWGKLSKTRPLPQLKWLNFIRCSRKTYRKTNAKLEKDKQSMYSKNRAGLPLESTLVCGLETSDSSRSLADEETSGGYFLTARWTLTGRRLQLLLSDHPLKPHLSHHVQCKKHTFWCTFVHKNSLFALCSTSFDSDNELGNLF